MTIRARDAVAGSSSVVEVGAASALVAELGGALEALVRDAAGRGARTVGASVRAPWLDPLGIADRALRLGVPTAVWCQPLAGRILVGAGEATAIGLEGADRFEAAEAARRRLAASAVVGGPAAGRPGAGLYLVGGAAFAVGAGRDAIWRSFGGGRLRLPRLTLVAGGDEAILTASIVLEPSADPATEIDAVRVLAEQLVGAWEPEPDGRGDADPAMAGEPRPRLRVAACYPDRPAWEAAVARAAGAVGRGRLDKVVLARRVDLVAEAPIDVAAVLRRLVAGAPGSTIFAVSHGGRDGPVFLGASPERLVEVLGRTLRTVALAGTIGRGADPDEDAALAAELLASEKDREEHAVVVDMLRTTLAPLVEDLAVDRQPRVVRLSTVQHLATEFVGRLRADDGLLGLVGRLHPTPAVGGWPREAALAYIEEEEGLDRGWYAGPVGWVDLAGDGEFVVGIRSGVVSGARASLFAGCGIVADSEPDREWEESELKLAALAGALGRFEGADDR